MSDTSNGWSAVDHSGYHWRFDEVISVTEETPLERAYRLEVVRLNKRVAELHHELTKASAITNHPFRNLWEWIKRL